jgi:rhodanese-related sulfurtransferase/ABC-type phosphate/phosphonate transport system substrate-binding protein
MTLIGASAMAQTPMVVVINPGDQGEQTRFAVYSAWKASIEQALRREKLAGFAVTQSNDARADLSAARTRIPDIFVAPAHIIGSAVRNGYTPVFGFDRPVRAVLVAPKDSAVSSLAQAKGKRLGLPTQDSVVTYLIRGEVHAANTTIKRHFAEVYETRYQDALLVCLQMKRCDVVAVEMAVFNRWVATGEPVKNVLETRPAPSISVALKNGSRPGPVALRAALTANMDGLPFAEGAKPAVLTAKDFEYVSTLGYFTPRALAGATLIDAPGVAQLVSAGGVHLIDTRNNEEFKAGHLPGAKLVPYVEKSAKDPDFDAKEDQFDVSQLPADKNSLLVFSCNGPECWKSFKASHAAIKAGYTRVHWFRNGFPGWRDAGMQVATGP